MSEKVLEVLEQFTYQIHTNKALVLKIIFLAVMVLLGHHRGLIHIFPIKIPIAHGINQILGGLVGLAVGIVILALTNSLLGW